MNLNYNIAKISKAVNGFCVDGNESLIKTVFIDSRCYSDFSSSLFIAIEGNHDDGHLYIEELYRKGLRYFMVNEQHTLPNYNDIIYIKVKDTLAALQKLAIFHAKQFNIPIIGITGSNGKTIIKEWLYHYLRNRYNIVRSPKSYNSQVGVPLSILQINDKHTLGIFEAGISLPGEMERLETMIRPDFGILTKIGTAHLQNFKDKYDLEQEKLILFKNAKWFHHYNTNNDSNLVKGSKLEITNTKVEKEFTTINIAVDKVNFTCKLPFTDKASIENACTCIHFLHQFNIPISEIISKTSSLSSVAFRLETQNGINNNTLIRDNYNSNLTSLSIALDYTQRFSEQHQVVILTDLLQDKINTSQLYKETAILINERKIDSFFGIGSNMMAFKSLFTHGEFYATVEDFIETNDLRKIKNSSILIKGTTLFSLNKISSLLVNKTHQTSLEIDLTALSNNINFYKNKLKPSTKIMSMVKAFGYGAGSKEIAQVLQHTNIDYLGVAYTDEGVELRKQQISTPILVMNMEETSYDEIIEHNLEPSIYSFFQFENFIRYLIDKNIKSYPIHLKIDTGMNRLGFSPSEIDQLIASIINQPEIYIKGIFSHLAAADDYLEDDFTEVQLTTFNKISTKIEENLGYDTIKNILNSSGIDRFPNHQLDMVRLGIGMYGISNTEVLSPVNTLKTKISQLKTVPKGGSIGYGRSAKVETETLIGIIPIGYADGFSRNLSNGKGSVLINGKLAPVIGRISMDMTTIDLSEIEGVKEGDEVEIFGKNRPISQLAKQMGTIAYEVLTSVSSRVVRKYTSS